MKFVSYSSSSLLVLVLGLAQDVLSVPTELASAASVSLSTDSTPASIEAIVDSDSTVVAASRKTDPFARCQAACLFLNILLRGKVSYPQSTIYEAQNIHWSQQQADVRSVCRVAPTAAVDVSATLLTLKVLSCQFAVKSGGHAAFKGASNIDEGVTIDLVNLKQVTLSADKTQASIGAGNRWLDVYSKLDPLGVSVVGGRIEDIGVGGLTLGGGISYFSGRYGFGCDNVNAYQVVFADGSIKEVTYKTYPDLFWALRGGGNNFGIVTRFDLKAFPQGEMWGGAIYYTIDKATEVFNALSAFAVSAPTDPYAAIWVATVYQQAIDMMLIVPQLMYGKPVVSPPIFKNFTDIPNIGSNLKTTTLTGQVAGTNGGYGFRQTYWTATFKNDAALIARIQTIWQEEIAPLKAIAGWVPASVFQPLSTGLISKFAQNGGNPLGISTSDGPLILFNTALQWSNAADDVRVFAAARNTINRATAEAKARGLSFKYIYENYAAAEQDVFESYGSANHAKLKAISKKYDPTGVFQTLQPGYFKVF